MIYSDFSVHKRKSPWGPKKSNSSPALYYKQHISNIEIIQTYIFEPDRDYKGEDEELLFKLAYISMHWNSKFCVYKDEPNLRVIRTGFLCSGLVFDPDC